MVVSLNTLLERSEKNMGNVNPSLKEYALELIKRCYKQGVYVQLASGYRSHEEQAKLFGQGRSSFMYKGKQYGRIKDANGKQLNIVTNAEPGQSIHNYGLAIDFFLVSSDGVKGIWDTYVDLDKDGKRDWLEVVAIAKKMGFEWGGDWKSFRDYPHLQYTKGLTLNQIGRGSRPAFPKLIVEDVVKPISKPVKPKPIIREEENELLKQAIVIGSLNDYAAAEMLSVRINAPIYPRKSIEGEVAKELILVGAVKKGLKADKITNLSGNDRFETAANVKKYLN